jgi:arsenate reductase
MAREVVSIVDTTDNHRRDFTAGPSHQHGSRLRILFLCTHNSCRSQMAEGWARHLLKDRFEPYSAGIDPTRVDARAARVMAEAGVDISRQQAKSISEIQGIDFDYVVTVCDQAREQCPYFPARVQVIHAGFDDPPTLAGQAKDEDEALTMYRRVRDEIRRLIAIWSSRLWPFTLYPPV